MNSAGTETAREASGGWAARSLRGLMFGALRATLLPRLLRERDQRRSVTIILYHDPTPDTIAAHFEALSRRYSVISLSAYLAARDADRLEELPPRPLIITFDDGHRRNRALLPVLRRSGIPVTIFLCSRIVGTHRHYWFQSAAAAGRVEELKTVPDDERLAALRAGGFEEDREYAERQALSLEEIEEMRDVVDFQSHTRLHPLLDQCSDDRSREELFGSKADLEALGLPIQVISYPNGNYTEREIEYAREAGYRCGITVDFGSNAPGEDPFRLKRICLPDDAGVSEALVKASGLWGRLRGATRAPNGGRGSGGDP